jgi:hypothetical protein
MSDTDTRQFTLTGPQGEIIAHGSISALMERLPDTHARNDALESMYRVAADAVEAEQRQEEAYASAVQIISETVAHLTNRMDAYITRREEQRKADEEQAEREEQEQIQSMLDALPDPDDPNVDAMHQSNTGDLTPLGPSENQTEQDTSAVPQSYGNVPMSYIKGKGQGDQTGDLPEGLERRSPPPLGTDPVYDPAELAHPQEQPPQPVAISLNAQEE